MNSLHSSLVTEITYLSLGVHVVFNDQWYVRCDTMSRLL